MMPDDRWSGAAAPGASGTGRPTPHDVAVKMLAFSAARIAAFAAFDLAINDIAWELLLALFVAQERGVALSVYGLCDTIDQPKGVSVRWLRALRACRLVDYGDDTGRSATAVRLTPAAADALRGLIAR